LKAISSTHCAFNCWVKIVMGIDKGNKPENLVPCKKTFQRSITT
jgi:hypothetical protein